MMFAGPDNSFEKGKARRRRGLGGLPFPVALLLFAAVLLAPPAASVRAQSSGSLEERIGDQKQQLKKIEDEIKQHRAKSAELKKKETDVVKQLGHLDKEISLATKYLSTLAKKEALLVQQIDSLRANISGESDVLSRQKERLALRVRRMYMTGPDQRWAFVMGGDDLSEKLRRYKFTRTLAEQDARLIREVSDRKQRLEVEQAGVAEALYEVARLRDVQQSEAEKLKKNKTTRVAMLNKIRKDDAKHKDAIADLEKSQEKLKDLIGELERKRAGTKDPTGLPPGGFAGLKGKLQRPVDGQVVAKFGKSKHPKFGTVTFNNGIDIQARAGAPIRAVAAGRVEFVDWIEGYGNCIIINHGAGYYTLYAHASEIFVKANDNVSANSVIAEVGDSGSLNGYACHFEIRKSKQALNPMEWFAN